MATLTIRNLDEKVKRRLQVRAALNGRSMEAEAREMLSRLTEGGPVTASPEEDLGTAIYKRVAALGVELDTPPRNSPGPPVTGIKQSPAGHVALNKGLGTAIHDLFAPLGGVELQIPPRRKSHRPIPTFEG
jgi:plasmid stability protein